MTNLFIVLVLKSSVALLATVCLARVFKSSSAADRKLLWCCTFAVLCALPCGLLVPADAGHAWKLDAVVLSAGARLAPIRSYVTYTAAYLWAFGAFVSCVRLTIAATHGYDLVKRARRCAEGRVRYSSEIRGPVAWSFGTGVVLLPDEARTWKAELSNAAIQHELAHIRHRDSETLLLAELACALYWFHPLVWYAARALRKEQEHAADDAVLWQGLDPRDYAEQLLRLARMPFQRCLFAGGADATFLAARISAILDSQRRRKKMNRKLMIGTFAAIFAVAVPLIAVQSERKVYKIGGEVTPPRIAFKQEPDYTPQAKEAKVEGTVLLSIVIESDGHVSDVKIVRGLDAGLDRNAVTAVSAWSFKPAEKSGSPVAVEARVEVNFRLL